MSVVTYHRQFRPDQPDDIELGRSALVSALGHATCGYPVIPVAPGKKQPPRKGMRRGTTDTDQIYSWWRSHSQAQVGIVLDGTGLVVLDVDGQPGEDSLTHMLEVAGVPLPVTYGVSTGCGRHLYYRVPTGGSHDLVSQYGGQHGRPGLDVKMTWLLMVPGSQHHSGRFYAGNWDHIPLVDELPFLPDEIWAQIQDRGRSRLEPAPRSRPGGHQTSAAAAHDPGLGEVIGLGGAVGARLDAMLLDVSDGRDGRVFSAVLTMLRAQVSIPDVRATILASPLGGKVTQQSGPVRYLSHKIESAQQYVDEEDRNWDPDAWWTAVLCARLGDAQVRVLHHLVDASSAGIVGRSTGKIALDTAMTANSASDTLKSLTRLGWLTVLREHDAKTMTPRLYALEFPPGQMPGAVSLSPSPPRPPRDEYFSPRNLSTFTGHDAFRARPRSGGAPTLNGGYAVMCLLTAAEPTSGCDLAALLGCSPRTLRRRLKPLQDAGLVLTDQEGHRPTTDPLRPLLDRAAERSGTTGIRAAQLEQYRLECIEAARRREAMATVGTPEWRAYALKDAIAALDRPQEWEMLRLWRERGVSRAEVAQMRADAYEEHLTSAQNVFEGWFETQDTPEAMVVRPPSRTTLAQEA